MPTMADFALPFFQQVREAAVIAQQKAENQAKAQAARHGKNSAGACKWRMESYKAKENAVNVARFANKYGA